MITGKKSTEPLMTLPELSEMLGVPADPIPDRSFASVPPAIQRVDRLPRGGNGRDEQWLETQADRRDQVGW
jgi:hypothetical protein